jgi:hypothetical protein
MNGRTEEGPGEFPGLDARLRRADFSGESRVKDSLKERLLAKAEKRSGRRPVMWLLPAAALAAALIVMNVRRETPRGEAPAASYNLPTDGYGECGRQGLADYMAGERF